MSNVFDALDAPTPTPAPALAPTPPVRNVFDDLDGPVPSAGAQPPTPTQAPTPQAQAPATQAPAQAAGALAPVPASNPFDELLATTLVPPSTLAPPPTPTGVGAARPTTAGFGGMLNSLQTGFSTGMTDLGINYHAAIPVLKYELNLGGSPEEVATSAAAVEKQRADNLAKLAPELPTDPTNPSWWAQLLGGVIPGGAAVGVGALAGGAAGSVLPGVGSVAGTLAGLFSSGAMTTNASAFFDYLRQNGVDTTDANATALALTQNPQLGSEASHYALKLSGVAGVAGLLGYGVGGAIATRAAGVSLEQSAATLARTGAVVAERAPWGTLPHLAAQAGAAAGIGAGQELSSEVLTDQPIDPVRIFAAGVLGPVSMAPAEALGAAKAFAPRLRIAIAARDTGVAEQPWVTNPTTNAIERNTKADPWQDPELVTAETIMKGIQEAHLRLKAAINPNAASGVPASVTDWQITLGRVLPTEVSQSQTGQNFFRMLSQMMTNTAKGSVVRHSEQDIMEVFDQARIRWNEVPNANANLTPTLRITNPYAAKSGLSPYLDVTMSKAQTFAGKSARPTLVVEATSRPMTRSEVNSLFDYARERKYESVSYEGDTLDKAVISAGKPTTMAVKGLFGGDTSTRMSVVPVDRWPRQGEMWKVLHDPSIRNAGGGYPTHTWASPEARLAHVGQVFQSVKALAKALGMSDFDMIDDNTIGGYGQARTGPKGKLELAVNSEKAGPLRLAATAFHEMGHLLWYDKFSKMDSNVLVRILEDFHQFYEQQADLIATRGPDRTLGTIGRVKPSGAFLGIGRSSPLDYIDTQGGLRNYRKFDQDEAGYVNYWHSFAEWFAQNISRWVQTDAKPLSFVEKHYAALANMIERTVSRFSRNVGKLGVKFDAPQALSELLNSMWTEVPPARFSDLYEKLAVDSLTANKRALNEMGAPHVDPVTQTAETRYGRGIATKLFSGKDMPEWERTKDGVQRKFEGLAAIGDGISVAAAKALGIDQIAKSNPDIFPLNHYNDVIKNAEGGKLSWIQDPFKLVLKPFKRLKVQEGKDLVNALGEMANMSYRTQKERDDGVERNPTPAELDAIKSKLSDPAKEVFDGYFKTVNDQTGRWLDALRMQITKQRITLPEKALRLQEVDALAAKIASTPNVPHERFGQYVYKIYDKNTRELVFNAHLESPRERAALRRQMEKQYFPQLYDHSETLLPEDSYQFSGMQPRFAKMVLDTLGNQLSTTQRRVLDDILYSTSPARRTLASFARKGDLPGYSNDFMRAYADFFLHNVNYLARVMYSDELQAQITELRKRADFLPNGDRLTRLANRMAEHFGSWITPKPDAWKLKSAAFFLTLGYVPRAAITNLTQIPLQTYPYLASVFGDARTINAITRSAIDHQTYYKRAKLGERNEFALKVLDQLVKTGTLTEALAPEIAGMAQGRNILEKYLHSNVSKGYSKFIEMSAWMFQMAEQMNRRLTAMSALKLASEHADAPQITQVVNANPVYFRSLLNQGFTVDEAKTVVFTKHAVETTQGIYARWARPNIFEGKKGTVLLFQSFKQQYMFMLWNYPQAALRSLLVMGFMGGLMGVPGVGDASDLVKTLAWKLFGKDLDLEREARRFIIDSSSGTIAPDLLIHGTSRYGFGIPTLLDLIGNTMHLGSVPFPVTDLSSSVGSGTLSPVQLWPLFDPDAMRDPMAAVGKAADQASGAAYSLGLALYQLINNPNPHNAWGLAPRALWNLNRAYQALHDNITTQNGAHIINFDPADTREMAEALAMGAGFNPLRLTSSWDRIKAIQEVESVWSFQRSMLVKQFEDAAARQDSEDKKRAINAIRQFNRMVPPDLGLQRIGPDVLRSGAKGRIKANRLMELGQAPVKSNTGVVRQMNRLYPEAGFATATPSGVPIPLENRVVATKPIKKGGAIAPPSTQPSSLGGFLNSLVP